MIIAFSLFTFEDKKAEEGVEHLREYLSMCVKYGMQNATIGRSKLNSSQFMISGHFEDEKQWTDLVDKLERCEIEGDCFIDLMPLLRKPPKFYSFENIT